jgi:signal transduction histidine kinase
VRRAVKGLAEEYTAALVDYVAGGGEAALLRAYQLGRSAVAEGLGVLEVAAVHQEAVVAAVLRMLAPEESASIARRASEFFAESLAPFEMTRRGFQEANALLRGLNQELEGRVQQIRQDYEDTRDQLHEQRRLERLKNEFISVVSHELRTPLTSIHGALGLITTGLGGELPPGASHLLDIAYRNSQRLVRLINDILDLQKIESGSMAFHLRPVDMRSLLQQAIEANQAYAQGLGVGLALVDTPPSLRVQGDPDRLMQVMTNLLSNAAKFSPPGESVQVSARREGPSVRVVVRDCGPGIPEPFKARIFEKFAQADASTTRDKGGTGLGLSITKAIVERLGGTIGFESQPTQGTAFHVDLPEWRRSSGRKEAARDTATPRANSPRGGRP